MVVADEELEALQAACLQALEEGAPVDFSLTEGDAEAEDLAFSIEADADGDEDGAVENATRLADFFVAGAKVPSGRERQLARDSSSLAAQ